MKGPIASVKDALLQWESDYSALAALVFIGYVVGAGVWYYHAFKRGLKQPG